MPPRRASKESEIAPDGKPFNRLFLPVKQGLKTHHTEKIHKINFHFFRRQKCRAGALPPRLNAPLKWRNHRQIRAEYRQAGQKRKGKARPPGILPRPYHKKATALPARRSPARASAAALRNFKPEHRLGQILRTGKGEIMRETGSGGLRPIIMSMHPFYAHKIVAGQKQVELRRRFPRTIKAGTLVYIYATAPDKSLIGRAKIARIECLNKQDLWDKYHLAACISEADFIRYFSGLGEAYALHLTAARRFARPLSLAELRRDYGFFPPQCFTYAQSGFVRA